MVTLASATRRAFLAAKGTAERTTVILVLTMTAVSVGAVAYALSTNTVAHAVSTNPLRGNTEWLTNPTSYTYTYTFDPDAPDPNVQVGTLSLSFPDPNQVLVSGSVMPLELSQTYDFDSVELAQPTPDYDFVPEPVTWLSLPPITGEPLPGNVYVRVSPAAPDDSHIVLQGTSEFTITSVSASEIMYTAVDHVNLVNTTKLHEYAAFLTPDPNQVDATVAALRSGFENVPMAEYHVVFDRVSGNISSIDAVWQKLPNGQIFDLEDLRTSPNRIELAIVRN